MLKGRAGHLVLGAFAGLAGWFLVDILESRASEHSFLFMAVFAAVFFSAALAMLSEIGARASLVGAAAIATMAAMLSLLGALRFSDTAEFLQAGHVVLAMVVLAWMPVPFVIARVDGGRWGWADYPALFMHSWNIVVRYASAWAFVGLVWLVLLLSSQLLQLVGISALRDALREPLVGWVVSGAVLGLGLAVVAELADLVSPYLLLRLLRLMVPIVLLVVLVFVMTVPLRGLSQLFGTISAGAMLLATAAIVVSLVSISVDQSDYEAVRGRLMLAMVRALALVLPVLAGLAVWAVVLRVEQYGWTPERVAAATGAGVALGYALLYALAVLRGRGWMERIRRGNLAMALGLIAVAALWLTPLFNAEAISAKSQLDRYQAGRIGAEQLPLWEMAHQWGWAGRAALEGLEYNAQLPGNEALAQRLALLSGAQSKWEFGEPDARSGSVNHAAELARLVPVLPQGEGVDETFWSVLGGFEQQQILEGCARKTPAGNPGCLLVIADLLSGTEAHEHVVLHDTGVAQNGFASHAFEEVAGGWLARGRVHLQGEGSLTAGAALDWLHSEGVNISPTTLPALSVSGQLLIVLP